MHGDTAIESCFIIFSLFALVKRVISWMESEQKMGWQFGEIMDSMRLYFAHWSQWYFCFSFWFPVYKWFLLLWIEQLMHHITPVMGVLGIILPFQEGILILTSFHVMASVTSSFSNSTIVQSTGYQSMLQPFGYFKIVLQIN